MRKLAFLLCVAAPLFADSISVISRTPPLKEGAVAISPIDSQIVLAAAIGGGRAPFAEIRTFYSNDGGASWTSRGVLSKRIGGQEVLGHWDPVLAYDRAGRAYLAVVAAIEELRWVIAVYRSDNNGLTWTGTQVSSSEVPRHDKPWLDVDDRDGLHLAWFQFRSGSELVYAQSRDRGETFSTIRTFPSFGWPYVTAGPDQMIYLSHLRDALNFDVLVSDDGGLTFRQPVRVAPQTSHLPLQMVADRTNGAYRHHVYAFVPGSSGLFFTRSTDRGRTWSNLVPITDGGWLPSIGVNRTTGEVVLCWMELLGNEQVQLAASRSTDGGATLAPARDVSPRLRASRPLGEYNQLAARANKHIIVYADEEGTLYSARLDPVSGAAPPPPPPAPGRRRRAVRPGS